MIGKLNNLIVLGAIKPTGLNMIAKIGTVDYAESRVRTTDEA